VRNIYNSVIHKNGWYREPDEMLIPKVIGEERPRHSMLRRLDRALTPGNRVRGYEDVI